MWTELYPGPANLKAPDSSCIKSRAMAFLLGLARDPLRDRHGSDCAHDGGAASGTQAAAVTVPVAYPGGGHLNGPFLRLARPRAITVPVCVYSPSMTMFMRFPGCLPVRRAFLAFGFTSNSTRQVALMVLVTN